MKLKAHILVLALFLVGFSCEDFVQVPLPDSRISSGAVFQNDETAMAAANGIYRTLLQNHGLLGGTLGNVTFLTAMSSDELINYYAADPREEFANNTLTVNNSYINNMWAAAYKAIYETNAVIEGVEASTMLSPSVSQRIKGEALFIRALCHFYLVNLFGDIPLATTSDYRVTAKLTRTSQGDVYQQIITDLENAQILLPAQYYLNQRTRPNKQVATALLARVHLYRINYEQAEQYATILIDDAAYALEVPENTFLTTSTEAIWQLSQVIPNNFPTADAFIFKIQNNFFQNSLTTTVIESFEESDLRNSAWTGQWINNEITYSYAHKYKERVAANNRDFKEYLVVLRLAEQYLIRAEARAHRGNLLGAVADLDKIRARAGLPLVTDTNPTITKDQLLEKIMHERQIEFFCEMGHRWLDLKRTEKVDQVLAPVKSNWSLHDALYPIPEMEMLSNPFLKPQNPGY